MVFNENFCGPRIMHSLILNFNFCLEIFFRGTKTELGQITHKGLIHISIIWFNQIAPICRLIKISESPNL